MDDPKIDFPGIHDPDGFIAKFSFLESLGFSLIYEWEDKKGRHGGPEFSLQYKDAKRSVIISLSQQWDRGHCDLVVWIDTAGAMEQTGNPKNFKLDLWTLRWIEDLYGLEPIEGGGAVSGKTASLCQDWDRIAERLSSYLPKFLNDIDESPLLEKRIQKLEDWKKSILEPRLFWLLVRALFRLLGRSHLLREDELDWIEKRMITLTHKK